MNHAVAWPAITQTGIQVYKKSEVISVIPLIHGQTCLYTSSPEVIHQVLGFDSSFEKSEVSLVLKYVCLQFRGNCTSHRRIYLAFWVPTSSLLLVSNGEDIAKSLPPRSTRARESNADFFLILALNDGGQASQRLARNGTALQGHAQCGGMEHCRDICDQILQQVNNQGEFGTEHMENRIKPMSRLPC